MPVIVAVTQPEYEKVAPVFDAAATRGLTCVACPPDEEQLASEICSKGARHAIVGIQPYSGPLYAALPKGGVLARFGVGHDGIDKAAATAAGLLCANTPGVLDDSVAEHAMALTLAAARHIASLAEATRRGAWQGLMGRELRGSLLAVIGCGAIGRCVARIAARGFGMRVVASDPLPLDAAELRNACGIERITTAFEDAVAGADFVSLHMPASPVTHHFINRKRLQRLGPGAWLINTARGAVVDEIALFDALKSGVLAGAALDVTEREPYVPADPQRDLRKLTNVILTPHVSSSTDAACRRIAERALCNIELAGRGEYAAMDLLNPEVLTIEN